MRYGALLVIIIQALIICLVFRHILFSGGKYVFSNQYDGVKNYFTLQGYVQQPKQTQYLLFGMMNYPYGDYVFYTDNTPLIAVPLRMTLNEVLGKTENAIFIFNLCVLAGFLLGSLLLYKLFLFFSISGIAVILASVMLPWFHPQVLRLFGHFNLTQSWILLLVILLLCKRTTGKSVRHDLMLAFVMFLSGFIHMYYLLLSLAFVSGYFFFLFVSEARHHRKWILTVLKGTAICIAALGLFFLAVRLADNYYDLRKATAEGYDWDDWKLQLRSFLTPYSFHPLKKWLGFKSLPYESFGYIGSGTIAGISGLLVFTLVNLKHAGSFFQETRSGKNFRIAEILFISSLVGVLIALGERVHIAGDVFVTNYLNPFFYLRKIIPQLTHFRCLGRFSWFFFWILNIGVVSLVTALAGKHRYFKVLLLIMISGMAFDMFFTLKHLAKDYKALNPFHPAVLDEVKKTMNGIYPEKYQGLLAFPFYHVGSEDYNYTIDPEDTYCVKTMQLSLASGLPLVNSKMSRTPLPHTYDVFSLFSDSIHASLLQKLNDKPLLVYLDKSFYANDSVILNQIPPVNRMPAKEVVLSGHRIIGKYGMRKLFENENDCWYEWNLSVDNHHLGNIR